MKRLAFFLVLSVAMAAPAMAQQGDRAVDGRGGWNFGSHFLRCSLRIWVTPSVRGDYLGFRLRRIR